MKRRAARGADRRMKDRSVQREFREQANRAMLALRCAQYDRAAARVRRPSTRSHSRPHRPRN
jgi:hypothetical protein